MHMLIDKIDPISSINFFNNLNSKEVYNWLTALPLPIPCSSHNSKTLASQLDPSSQEPLIVNTRHQTHQLSQHQQAIPSIQQYHPSKPLFKSTSPTPSPKMNPKRLNPTNLQSIGPIPVASKPSLPKTFRLTLNSLPKQILALNGTLLVMREFVPKRSFPFLKKSKNFSRKKIKKSKFITVTLLMRMPFTTLSAKIFMFLGSKI